MWPPYCHQPPPLPPRPPARHRAACSAQPCAMPRPVSLAACSQPGCFAAPVGARTQSMLLHKAPTSNKPASLPACAELGACVDVFVYCSRCVFSCVGCVPLVRPIHGRQISSRQAAAAQMTSLHGPEHTSAALGPSRAHARRSSTTRQQRSGRCRPLAAVRCGAGSLHGAVLVVINVAACIAAASKSPGGRRLLANHSSSVFQRCRSCAHITHACGLRSALGAMPQHLVCVPHESSCQAQHTAPRPARACPSEPGA